MNIYATREHFLTKEVPIANDYLNAFLDSWSSLYDVRCPCLPQYSTLVSTSCRPWIHWNDLLYSSQSFLRCLLKKPCS